MMIKTSKNPPSVNTTNETDFYYTQKPILQTTINLSFKTISLYSLFFLILLWRNEEKKAPRSWHSGTLTGPSPTFSHAEEAK